MSGGGSFSGGTKRARVAGAHHVVGADQLGASVVVVRADGDEKVGTERLGDLLAEERIERAAVDASQDLTAQVAEGPAVVLAAGPRFPHRAAFGESGGHRGPVETLVRCDRHRWPWLSRLMGQNHPDCDFVLAGLRILGPVRGHGFVDVEQPAIDE